MSVYTSLTRAEVDAFLCLYGINPLINYSGISAGIENTNYKIQTAQGDFVLTLYEHFSAAEVSSYLELLVQLGRQEHYYPEPLADRQQNYLQVLAGKPAALFKCLAGESVHQATATQLSLLASALAQFHLQSATLVFTKENARNIDWILNIATQVDSCLSLKDSNLLADELGFQLKHSTEHLRQGVIHADLFRDNVLFSGENLTGLLDFYTACRDCYLLDIAITLNDWCTDQYAQYSRTQHAKFMYAYQQLRELDSEEHLYLPILLRWASLRFWLSRIEHKLNPKEGMYTQEKDPEVFKNLLLQHRQFYAQQ